MGTNGDAYAAGVAACTGIPMCRIGETEDDNFSKQFCLYVRCTFFGNLDVFRI